MRQKVYEHVYALIIESGIAMEKLGRISRCDIIELRGELKVR
jgi:hypothetical protein